MPELPIPNGLQARSNADLQWGFTFDTSRGASQLLTMSHQRCSIEQLPNATRVGKTIEVQDNTRVLPCLEAHLMEVCSNCLLKRVCLPEFDNQMDKTVVTRYRVDI